MKSTTLGIGSVVLLVFLASCGFQMAPNPADMADLDMALVSSAVVLDSESSKTILYAGQNIEAGEVSFDVQDNSQLLVTYTTYPDWELTEAHLWVGTSLEDMPQTNKGNPKIGNFPYNAGDITGATTYTFYVDLAAFGDLNELCGTELFVAAHAALRSGNDIDGYQTETGWADGERFTPRGSWATYVKIKLLCDDQPPIDDWDTDTAYAVGEIEFPLEGAGPNAWGFAFKVSNPESGILEVYAGAAQNDLTKGWKVGSLSYDYDGTNLTLVFEADDPARVKVAHVYAEEESILAATNNGGQLIFRTPGQYGETRMYDYADSFEIVLTAGSRDDVSFNGSDLYVAVHLDAARPATN